MRIASALTLVAAAAVSFTASAAPTAANVDTSVPVSAHSGYNLSQSELSGVTGSYILDDGRTLRVTTEHRRLYAELGKTQTELVALSPNTFASRDDAVRVIFNGVDAPTSVKVSTLRK